MPVEDVVLVVADDAVVVVVEDTGVAVVDDTENKTMNCNDDDDLVVYMKVQKLTLVMLNILGCHAHF